MGSAVCSQPLFQISSEPIADRQGVQRSKSLNFWTPFSQVVAALRFPRTTPTLLKHIDPFLVGQQQVGNQSAAVAVHSW